MAQTRWHNQARRVVRSIHLWLGLTLGALFVLAGLTGSILVFYVEIDGWLHPVAAEGRAKDVGEWERPYQTLRTAFPDKQGPWRLEVTGRNGPIPARYYQPAETAGRDFAPMLVWLSPDGRTVLRRDFWGQTAMSWIYDLHYRLQAEKTGQAVMGYAGLALLGLLITGLWAWWPRRGQWRKALRFKRNAAPQRRLYDWHKLAGLWGAVPLIMLTATGVMLALPRESDRVLAATLAPVAPMVRPDVAVRGRLVSVDAAAAIARQIMPAARLAWIETPAAAGGAYRFRMQQAGDPSRRFPHSFVWIDAADGRVLAVTDNRGANASGVVNSWLHPLHDGSAGGMVLRIICFVAGLVPLVLFITGWLRWRRRAAV